MSEVITDKLTGRATAGDVTITSEGGSATMQLQQGVAKQWCSFDGTASTLSLDDSLNTSGLTDNATGNYSCAFTNNMSNANYYSNADANASRIVNSESRTTSGHTVRVGSASDGSNSDRSGVKAIVAGDLA